MDLQNIITVAAGLVGTVMGMIGMWWRVGREQTTKQLESENTTDLEKYKADSSQQTLFLQSTIKRIDTLERHNVEQDVTIERLVRENAKLAAQVDLLTEQNKMLLTDLKRTKEQRDSALLRADEAEQKAAELNDYIQAELSEAVERVDTLEMDSDAYHESHKPEH